MAPLYCLLFFLIYFSREHCYAIDSITNTKFLQDPQFIVSGNGTFKLGFFSPQNSANRYVGIWFNKVPTQTVVWVANRDTPIKDSSGVLKISDDGNLQLINGQKVIIWSTNVTSTAIKNSTAQLQESGNLVLQQSNSTDTLWQSFDHPTDTFLPGMNPTIPGTSNMKNIIFKSWKSLSDPSEGSFSIGIGTPNGLPQVFTWKDGANYWRSGPFDGNNFIGLPNVDNTLKDGFVLNKNDGNGTYDMSFDPEDASWLFNYVVIPNGTIIEQYWNEANWTPGWVAPSSACEVYAKCGPFGSCDHDSATCKCLQGFQPKFDQEWRKGNTSSGCVRRKKLECGIQGGTEDVFLRLQTMKVPDNSVQVSAFSQDGCRTNCVTNCSCLAYAYHLNIGCMIWNQDLIDTQDFSAGGVDLYIRLAASELEKNSAHKRVAIIISVTIVSAIVAATIIYFLRRRKMSRGKREKSNRYKFEVGPVGQLELQEPPLYTYDLLRYATNNFDESNKLGEGGFGPVYKGSLENGQEIAVKRLSKSSGQGLEEFMTEVKVISKLQHRNLVRLLGCCIEGEEKMLVYEYMPNRSLDAFLFNSLHHEHLSWEKRFNIIEGICRGLLYLHRDSRLRIIHRDLKPSNILLDEDLNPKISDFGMARIFGGNQDQANTRRVVGTYGYMSPEYTMGHFSEKSDVYSFGVILLEIVSGRRNSTFHREEQSLTLVGNAWKLWNEGNMISFIDSVILEPSFQESILKCIQIGLLCVQELSKDRPNISTVITMLDTDTKDLPHPKRPPFTEWEISSEDQQSSSLLSSSTNTYSTTIIQGR